MIEFMLADFNLLFSCAIFFVFILLLIEGLGLIIGFSLMNALDQLTGFDLDADIDLTAGGLTSLLGWLCLNRLPMLIWLVLFLSSFGIFGYSINYFSPLIFETSLASYLVVSSALIITVYFIKLVAAPLTEILPKNESSAISNHSFVGKLAKITQGKASFQNPTEAVLQDEYHQKHYLLVAPQSKDEIFIEGTEVVLVEKNENYWLGIAFNQNLK